MALRFRGLASIGCREDTTPRSRGCRRRCDGLVHTVAVRRRRPRPRHRRPAGPGGGRLLGDRRPRAPARRPVRPTSTTSSVPSIQPPTGDLGVFTLRSTGVRRRRGDPRRAHLHGRGASRRRCPGPARPPTPPRSRSSCATANAGGFVHWVVTGIDPFVQGIGEGGVPENAVEGPNGAGTVGWIGPCPPAGSGTHTYEVALLALPGVVDAAARRDRRAGGVPARGVGDASGRCSPAP